MGHFVKPRSQNSKRVENVVAAGDLPQGDSYNGRSNQTEESNSVNIHVGLSTRVRGLFDLIQRCKRFAMEILLTQFLLISVLPNLAQGYLKAAQ